MSRYRVELGIAWDDMMWTDSNFFEVEADDESQAGDKAVEELLLEQPDKMVAGFVLFVDALEDDEDE